MGQRQKALSPAAFVLTLKASLRPEIEVIEVEAHINHPLFAETMVEVLDRLMQRKSSESSAG